ncbi:MAG: hypothetical protein ABI688_10675 [Bacteroidota bacterium]
MKKLILLWLFCQLSCPGILFSQHKDSLDQLEIQRYNRMRDSLYRAGLAKDSAFQVQMQEAMQKTMRGIAESKQKEVEEATKEVLQRKEKEQGTKRRTMLWAGSAFVLALVLGRLIFTRKKVKK